MVWGKWLGRLLAGNECGGHTRAAPEREGKREGLKGWYDFVEDLSRGRSRECLPGFLPECPRPLSTLRKNRPRLLKTRGLSGIANNKSLPLATLTLPGAQNIYSNVRGSANALRRWVDMPVLQRVA